MEQYFRIGVITTTHGLKGEVKVFPTTEDPTRFEELNTCFLKEKEAYRPLTIRGCRYFKNLVIVGFEEINTIEEAMLLKQKELYVDREHAIPLEEGEYYTFDIIGLEVFDMEGQSLGFVTEVLKTGSNDVYVTSKKGEAKQLLIPALKAVVKEINIPEGRMVVDMPEEA